MGHGPRGLQRRRRMPGTTSATTRRARAPTAGARTGSPGSPTTSQLLCFALALWNGQDPILKERLFGLTNSEGNHGEDVKEYYFYLDSTPTHSYMKYLYKYPQAAYPYDDLVADEPRPEPARARVRAARHRRVRPRTATSTCSSSTPRRPRTTSSSGSPSRTAARSRPRCTCCRRSGSATPGRGAATRRGRMLRQRDRRHRCERDRGLASGPRRARVLSCEGARRAAVHRERDQHRAALRALPTARRTSRTGSSATSSTASATR